MHAPRVKPGRTRPEITEVEEIRLEGTPHMYRQGVTFVPLDSYALRKAFLEEVKAGVYSPENGYSKCQCDHLKLLADSFNATHERLTWLDFLTGYIHVVRQKFRHMTREEAFDLLETDFGRLLAWACRDAFPKELWITSRFGALAHPAR